MSNISIGTRRRTSKKNPASRASFGLFLAAAAIALTAAGVRIRKDRAAAPDTFTLPSAASQQAAGTTEQTQAAAAQPTSPADEQAAAAPKAPQKTDTGATRKTAVPQDSDEWEDSEQTLAIQAMGQNVSYTRPAGGAITKPYSMTSLVYSRTMGDWRTHNGLDLAAGEGETVRSAAEGTVAGVSEDPLYGVTVVVNQNDGLMVYYRGLSRNPAVREGENVSAGTTLGTVGKIPCESADGSHLHIEVKKENQFLDPAVALGIQ